MSELRTVNQKAVRCPFCEASHDRATEIKNSGIEPVPGDFALCINCGEWGIYDPLWTGGLRKPKFAEYQEIVADPECSAARRAWLAVGKPR